MTDKRKTLYKRVVNCCVPSPTRLTVWSVLLVVLGACATAPVPLSDEERGERTTELLDDLFGQYPAVQRDLTLGEAMARALLFNLDDRVQLLQIAVEEKANNLERIDLLPKLMLEAGYSSISENLASYNKNTITEIRSTQPTVSTEDESAQASLSLAWNVLDFGASYVRSKQRLDRIFIAEARRQQTMQNVLTDVRAAFWRAYAAQQWEQTIEELLADLSVGFENSRRAGESGAVAKEEALRVQSALLETMGDLLAVKKRLTGAKSRLAALMNLRPGESYRLTLDENVRKQIEREREVGFVGLELDAAQVEKLEEKALITRPELQIADYNVRIMRRETKRLMLAMLPGIDLSVGGYYDGNDFKRYDQFTRLGLNVGYDLVNLIRWPAHKKHSKNRILLETEKRKAIAMAALTQFHVALAQHELTQRRLKYADQLARVDEKIFIESSNQLRAGATPPNRVLQSRLNFVESGLTRDWLFAERQRAVDQLYIAAGISLASPLPKSVIDRKDPAVKLTDLSRSMALRSTRLLDFGEVMAARAAGRALRAEPTSVVNSETKPSRVVAESLEENTSLPAGISNGGGVYSSNSSNGLWCVRVAYFTTESIARGYVATESLRASRKLVLDRLGAGFIIRSEPLNFNDAYDFRAEARGSFARDAFIRRCPNSADRSLESESFGAASSIVRPKRAVIETVEKDTLVNEGNARRGPVQSSGNNNTWCVKVGFFNSELSARRFIVEKRAMQPAPSRRLVIDREGEGVIVRAMPLNFDDAYDFRTEARAGFSPDAYIRKCP